MKTKTIIVHDPDERAVVAIEGVGDRSRFRLDKVAFEWRGSAALKPFKFALDLRGGSLDDEERTASLDVPGAVAETLRAAALELDAKAAKTGGVGAATRPVEPSNAFRKRLLKTFAVALQALALDLTDKLDAETAVKIALRTVDEGADGASEAVEARGSEEASGAGAFQAEKAKAFAAKFRADAETANGVNGAEEAVETSGASEAKEAVETKGKERASVAREEGGAR